MDNCNDLGNVPNLVWDCWKYHAEKHPKNEAIIHWDALGKPFRWTYLALFEEALNVASSLIDRGVKHGDICALIMRHNKLFYPIYMGISLAGAVPVVLAYPNARLHPDKFIHGISGIAHNSNLDWILTERELAPIIKPIIMGEKCLIKDIIFPLEWEHSNRGGELNQQKIIAAQSTVKGSDPCLLQFSSGTTGLQKGVVLSHRAILEHVKRYSEAININKRDKIISWLPLYHDMGLIAAFHMPLICGIPIIQIDPFQWVSAPIVLFQAIHEEKVTMTWLPNFAYNFMADNINEEDLRGIDLGSMRMYVNCGEVVRAESHEKFINKFGKNGVKAGSMGACYAMAETTFAVTQTTPGVEANKLELDRDLSLKRTVSVSKHSGLKKICVSSGKPISGCALKIMDKSGSELPEDQVGSIAIRTASLFDGYLHNPEKTGKSLNDGWYHSGDLGFCHDGECYVLGREDDLIIVAGNNVYPEDIEYAVNQVAGVIHGRVVAFGVDNPETGTQKVCVIAETAYDNEVRKNALKEAIVRSSMDIDVTISTVYLVSPRWLIKSSSGKLSRNTNKERILEQEEADQI